jgi:hypothetical protein
MIACLNQTCKMVPIYTLECILIVITLHMNLDLTYMKFPENQSESLWQCAGSFPRNANRFSKRYQTELLKHCHPALFLPLTQLPKQSHDGTKQANFLVALTQL